MKTYIRIIHTTLAVVILNSLKLSYKSPEFWLILIGLAVILGMVETRLK